MKKSIGNAVKTTTIIASMMLFVLGTYNAMFMNSLDFMMDSEIKFAKRLDEINGRIVAAKAPYKNWTAIVTPKVEAVIPKIIKKPSKKLISKVANKKKENKEVEVSKVADAVIASSLELKLTEVYNVKKYPAPLNGSQFNGELYTSNGVIESLNVQLPNNEEIDINLAQMAGNVFSYDSEGEELSGMIYEVSKGTYMVTLTNGSYAGTRMKFLSNDVQDQFNSIAQDNGNYWDTNLQNDQQLQAQATSQVANGSQMPQQPVDGNEQLTFNFDQQQAEI